MPSVLKTFANSRHANKTSYRMTGFPDGRVWIAEPSGSVRPLRPELGPEGPHRPARFTFHRLWILGTALLLLAQAGAAVADENELDWIHGTQAVASTQTSGRINGTQPSLKKVGGGLAVVLGGFFLLTVLLRKQAKHLPANEMMEPLGSVPITPKVRLHLVRFGARILVLHISGQDVQRVAELDDPAEVQKLLASRQDAGSPCIPVSVGDLLQSIESVGDPMRGQLR